MSNVIKTLVILCFSVNLSFAGEDSTYLSRICEFDVNNTIGLENTGNFEITFEHISYSIHETYELDISYRYKIRKITQTENNYFGLSLRSRGHFGGGGVSDAKVNTLNITVNGRSTRAMYINSPYAIIDNDFNTINIDFNNREDMDKYFGDYLSNGYIGWYYFNVDFAESAEADIIINYETNFIGDPIRYNSRPFWIPVSGNAEIKMRIENNANNEFLSSITGCSPKDTLVTENWTLEKLNQSTVLITYAPLFYSESKGIRAGFSYLYEGLGSPNNHFFEIIRSVDWAGGTPWFLEDGVHLKYAFFGQTGGDNISRRELAQYEFIFLNNWQLRIMRNAFYARYRYRFRDDTLNEIFYGLYINDYYFNANNFYNANFTESMLSPVERRNIQIIQRLENLVR
jgi:hypothetical protein